jgi:transcriptional regulator with XRE-family HTH domain
VQQGEDLGTAIRRLRQTAGLSVEELAIRAGTSAATVSRLERGRTRAPRLSLASALARALGFASVDALMSGASPAAVLSDPSEPPESSSSPLSPPLADMANAVALASAAIGVRPLPIYRWGTAGDPRDHDSPPDPDRLEFPPLGRELLIGPNGFGVEVRGESMANRSVHEGDIVWCNPNRPPRMGGVVLARVSDAEGESGMVVKVWKNAPGARLVSDGAGDYAGTPVVGDVDVIGPVVLVSPKPHPPS